MNNNKINSNPGYSFEDLLYLMQRLRDPQNGCPWDLKQTPQSIINHSLEEVYELADVVENDSNNADAFKDELGDVLFQVIFMAQLAKDAGDFSFEDVASHLCNKMINRHPHVFPDGKLNLSDDSTQKAKSKTKVTERDVKSSWEAIKQDEKREKLKKDLFTEIPLHLPALTRAAKLQKRAASIGLDWENVSGVREKLGEEIEELDEALENFEAKAQTAESKQQIGQELGDVLFTVVNLARHLALNPEQLLRHANHKFTQRVSKFNELIEEKAPKNRSAESLSSAELDELWQNVKKQEA